MGDIADMTTPDAQAKADAELVERLRRTCAGLLEQFDMVYASTVTVVASRLESLLAENAGLKSERDGLAGMAVELLAYIEEYEIDLDVELVNRLNAAFENIPDAARSAGGAP